MPFSSVQFLGATVRGVQSSLGWNGDSSRLSVSLVEDVSNGDIFNPVLPGQPIYFQLGTFKFFGLLKRWTKNKNVGGYPTYEVECGDPRSLLESVQIIVDSYQGSIQGITNLINAYGYWENTLGFGGAQVNETGMPWRLVRNAVVELCNLPAYTSYGGPITYKGYSYSVDLSELPELPLYFRISGPSISLMDFIIQICQYSGHDFFVELIGYKIKIRTASRHNQPSLGTINALINTGTGTNLISNSDGLEERNEFTEAFLVGGQAHTLYKSTSIETFWGYDINLNPILGISRYFHVYGSDGNYLGTRRGHYANLNASPIADIIGHTVYACTTWEMQSALMSLNTWYDFISRFRPEVAAQLGPLDMGLNEAFRGSNNLPQDRVGPINANAHEQNPTARLQNMGRIAVGQDRGLFTKTKRIYEFVKHYAQNYMGRKYLARLPFVLSKRDAETLQVYFSYEIADAGYTEETTLSIPGVGTIDLENDLDNLAPLYKDLFQSFDGRYVPFVYYADTSLADFSNLNVGQTILQNSTKLFAKAQLEEKIVFIPEPAAIVNVDPLYELPNQTVGGFSLDALFYQGSTMEISDSATPNNSVAVAGTYVSKDIRFCIKGSGNRYRNFDGLYGTMRYFGGVWTGNATVQNANSPFNGSVVTLVASFQTEDINNFTMTTSGGNGSFAEFLFPNPEEFLSINPLYVRYVFRGGDGVYRIELNAAVDIPHRNGAAGSVPPNMHPTAISINHAHIPLRSNILTYGPWFAGTTPGKTHVEVDSSLVPWNYGGYTNMNLAANAKVSSLVTDMTISETGQLEEENVPRFSLGDLMDSAGPNLTRINVSFGTDGVKTSYAFETFVPRFGHIGKYMSDRIRRATQIGLSLNREMKQRYRQSLVRANTIDRAVRGGQANLLQSLSASLRRQSTHTVFVTKNVMDNGRIRPFVSTATLDEAMITMNADDSVEYDKGVVADWSSLIRPISIYGSGLHISAMDGPRGIWREDGLNSYKLNPIIRHSEGQDFQILSHTSNEGESYGGLHHYRDNLGNAERQVGFVALRGPMIVTGHGYDISGNYVPGASNYLTRSDLWKTGPVDLRWDNARKVWTCNDVLKGKTAQIIPAATSTQMGSGYVNLYKDSTNSDEKIVVYNWFSVAVASNVKVLMNFHARDNKYIISSHDC